MRLLGFFLFSVWTFSAVWIGYNFRSVPEPTKPIIVERVCPDPEIEPPLVLNIKEVVVHNRKQEQHPSSTAPVQSLESTIKPDPIELLVGYQRSDRGGSLEAMLNLPVMKRIGVYVGVTTGRDYSVGLSYRF